MASSMIGTSLHQWCKGSLMGFSFSVVERAIIGVTASLPRARVVESIVGLLFVAVESPDLIELFLQRQPGQLVQW
jgi:hypothetical protein